MKVCHVYAYCPMVQEGIIIIRLLNYSSVHSVLAHWLLWFAFAIQTFLFDERILCLELTFFMSSIAAVVAFCVILTYSGKYSSSC